MYCYTCKTKMECVNYAEEKTLTIEFVKCNNCGSTATIKYKFLGVNKKVEEVEWFSE